MSAQHPVIAVTGSSGAATATLKTMFEHLFARAGIAPAMLDGDSFHRYDRYEMLDQADIAAARGHSFTRFSPEANLLPALEELFRHYGRSGGGRTRHYAARAEDARRLGVEPGRFTEWAPLEPGSDLLFYQGLHGGYVDDAIDIAGHTDLLIGYMPLINLEWAQSLSYDRELRGYSTADATARILARMPDYVRHICPQFSRTDINFQRVATVDTANPFALDALPGNDESLIVVHAANHGRFAPDYRALLEAIDGSFMSRADTLVIPAHDIATAMELIVMPVIHGLVADSKLSTCPSAA